MFAIALWLLVASLVPRVEDPLPERIGLEFPFAMAGACGVLASVIFAEAGDDRRDRLIRQAGRIGFLLGAGGYLIALAVQVVSQG